MEFVEESLPARETKFGQDEFQASAGQYVAIATTPAGETILSAQVPQGKVWDVEVTVRVLESPE